MSGDWQPLNFWLIENEVHGSTWYLNLWLIIRYRLFHSKTPPDDIGSPYLRGGVGGWLKKKWFFLRFVRFFEKNTFFWSSNRGGSMVFFFGEIAFPLTFPLKMVQGNFFLLISPSSFPPHFIVKINFPYVISPEFLTSRNFPFFTNIIMLVEK